MRLSKLVVKDFLLLLLLVLFLYLDYLYYLPLAASRTCQHKYRFILSKVFFFFFNSKSRALPSSYGEIFFFGSAVSFASFLWQQTSFNKTKISKIGLTNLSIELMVAVFEESFLHINKRIPKIVAIIKEIKA